MPTTQVTLQRIQSSTARAAHELQHSLHRCAADRLSQWMPTPPEPAHVQAHGRDCGYLIQSGCAGSVNLYMAHGGTNFGAWAGAYCYWLLSAAGSVWLPGMPCYPASQSAQSKASHAYMPLEWSSASPCPLRLYAAIGVLTVSVCRANVKLAHKLAVSAGANLAGRVYQPTITSYGAPLLHQPLSPLAFKSARCAPAAAAQASVACAPVHEALMHEGYICSAVHAVCAIITCEDGCRL